MTLHSLLGLGLLALVAGCATESDANSAAASEDLSGDALRFSSSTLGPTSQLAFGNTTPDGRMFASYIDEKQGLVVIRSDDDGVTWTTIGSIEGIQSSAQVYASPSDANVIYVTRRGAYSWGYGGPEEPTEATWPGGLFLRSDDGGKTWNNLSENLPEVYQGKGFDTLDINPTNPKHLVAANCNGVQKSIDGGKTWNTLPGTGSSNCNGADLYRGINDRKVIYALYDVGEGGGSVLMRTYDDGVTWQSAGHEVTGGYGYLVGARKVVVHPDDAKHIYVTDMSAFFSSADGGDKFFIHNRGLGEDPSSVAVNPANGALYITNGDSVFRWAPAAGEPENGHWNRVARIPNLAEGQALGAPVIANGHLYVANGAQLLIAPL